MSELTAIELLKPISAEAPAGVDLREDEKLNGSYHEMQTLRHQLRLAERKRMQSAEIQTGEVKLIQPSEWKPLFTLIRKALSQHTKDMELACWMTEAWVRIDGYAGLTQGLALMSGLVEHFWDTLYPPREQDIVSSTLFALVGLMGSDAPGTLIMPLSSIVLTEGQEGFCLWQYEQAVEATKPRPQAAAAATTAKAVPTITVEKIQAAAKQSTAEFITALRANIVTAQEQFKILENQLEKRLAKDAPPLTFLRKHLQTALAAVEALYAKPAPTTEEKPQQNQSVAIASGSGGMTRAQAVAQLETLAQFFAQTEPHSPLSYTLARAARWGKMDLSQLVYELFPSREAAEQFCRVAGIVLPK